MKKVLCPRCDNYLTFDETKYQSPGVIHFICQYCGRRFGVRLGSKEADATNLNSREGEICGYVNIIENQFCHKQRLPLYLGNNIVGRRNKGNDIQVPIITGDMSVDRQHCVINIKRNKDNKLIYTLKDFDSLTGTFLYNKILDKNEIITLTEDPETGRAHV